MVWWAWLLIWGVLVLAMLGMLALSGVRLFRKVVRVFESLADLVGKAEVLEAAEDGHGEAPPIALLQKRSAVLARRDLELERRDERRAARHSRRIARARTLIGTNVASRRWFQEADSPLPGHGSKLGS
jgi:hypothetical protein